MSDGLCFVCNAQNFVTAKYDPVAFPLEYVADTHELRVDEETNTTVLVVSVKAR